MASIKEISKSINKAWKDEVLVTGNFVRETERLSVGDLSFDYATYGGIPEGCLVTFSGCEHSGKTTAACLAMASYQKKYPSKVCIYVDAENTLLTQSDFISRMTGLDIYSETFMRYDCTGKCAEEIFSDVLKLEEADDIGLIVIDSLPALISKADLENDFEKDSGMRSSVAKSLGKFIKQMIMYLPKRNNILLLINQVREDGKTFTGIPLYKEPCGYAPNYFSSTKVRFGTRNYTLGDTTDLSQSKGEGADGFRLKFSVTKNRLGPSNRGGGFLTFRYATGLDAVFDTLEVALKFGFIQRPNAVTYIPVNLDTGEYYIDPESGEELKFRGKQALFDYLNSHEEFKTEYIAMLTKNVSAAKEKVNLLDKKDLDEILNQEAILDGKAENITEENSEDE